MALRATGTRFMRNLWCIEHLLGMTGNALLLGFIIAMIRPVSHRRCDLCQCFSVDRFLLAPADAEYFSAKIRRYDNNARKNDSTMDNPPGFLLR